jgi:MFS transporter, ACS family, hexuronate transporter
MSNGSASRSATWKWSVCAVLLLATMLNYMDRQTLSQTAARISSELKLSQTQYGRLEVGFGVAFAAGGLLTGMLVDSIPVRWMYPTVVVGWSLAGFATAYAAGIGRFLNGVWGAGFGEPLAFAGLTTEASDAYLGLLVCRVVLGLFEAGQWPCALVTTQRLLSQKERTLGNSVLQSGASIGAIVTPFVVLQMVSTEAGSWRLPFAAIGAVGLLWVVPWFMLIGRGDLERQSESAACDAEPARVAEGDRSARARFWRRYVALICVVVTINLTWHYFRAWLPKYLTEFPKYPEREVGLFTSAYYVSTDIGCLAAGIATRWLAARGSGVHSARVWTFLVCACLTGLAIAVPRLDRGFPQLAVLLLVGAGSLGMFPIYYSLSQELSTRSQGRITGSLSAITWLVTAAMHEVIGRVIDHTHSHTTIMTAVALLPFAGWLTLWHVWDSDRVLKTEVAAT